MALSTLFVAASAVSGLGTLAGAAAQYQGLQAQKAGAEQNAKIAMAEANAEAARQARVDARARASALALMGSSGIMINSGSNLSVLSDMAAQQAENQLQIMYRGQAAAANAKNRATAYGQQATGALIGGGAKFAGGVASAAYTYDNTWGGGNGRLFS